MPPDRTGPDPSPGPNRRDLLRLVDAVEDVGIVDPSHFTALVEGLCALRADLAVLPALIAIWPGAPGTRSSCLAEVVLTATVRDVDAIGRLDDGVLAVLVDADAGHAVLVAHRIHDVLRRALAWQPVWIGVSWATSGTSPEELAEAAVGALAVARRQPCGTVELARC